MSETAGQAAREAFGELGADWYPGTPWNGLHPDLRAQWEVAASAAIGHAADHAKQARDGELTQMRYERDQLIGVNDNLRSQLRDAREQLAAVAAEWEADRDGAAHGMSAAERKLSGRHARQLRAALELPAQPAPGPHETVTEGKP